MLTDIEQQFFKAFDIEPIKLSDCSFINMRKGYEIGTDYCPSTEEKTIKCENCKYSKIKHYIYPEITDRILLKLIVIGNKLFPAVGDNLDELKQQVLYWTTKYHKLFYNKVRALFNQKGKENG